MNESAKGLGSELAVWLQAAVIVFVGAGVTAAVVREAGELLARFGATLW